MVQTLPIELDQRLQALLSPEEYQKVIASFSLHRPTSLRTNTLKTTPAELLAELSTAGFKLSPVPWWNQAFILTEGTLYDLTAQPAYREGRCYVQSLSSMLPPLILNPQPNDHVLDLTAAPGSKTTELAALIQNHGEIIANDLSSIRLFKLQANLKLQGVTNTRVRRGPGELLWQKFPEYFDCTLVDVPCSMEGRIQFDDPETLENWSVAKIKQLSIRQCHLLRSAVTATKVGGRIVYSTCTLAPEENEHVVQWLLEKSAGAVVLESIHLNGVEFSPSVTQWQKEVFLPELQKTRRITPSSTMEGFFIASLRKVRSTLPLPHRPRFQRKHR